MVELGLSLGETLSDVFDAPLGVLQFLGVLRDEVLDRLVGIAGDDLEPGGQRGQILLLLRLLGDLILQGFGGVDDRGLRARLHFDELGAHGDALLKGRDEVLLRLDRLPQFVGFGGLLRALGVECGDIRRQLSEIGGENTGFALAQSRRDSVRPGDRRDGIEAMRPRARKRGLAPQDFRLRRRELGARAFPVGQGGRAVELDQHLARPHNRAIAGVDRLDPAGFQGLDDLDLSRRLKLALRGGDDVDAAEIGPGEGADDERADDP